MPYGYRRRARLFGCACMRKNRRCHLFQRCRASGQTSIPCVHRHKKAGICLGRRCTSNKFYRLRRRRASGIFEEYGVGSSAECCLSKRETSRLYYAVMLFTGRGMNRGRRADAAASARGKDCWSALRGGLSQSRRRDDPNLPLLRIHPSQA